MKLIGNSWMNLTLQRNWLERDFDFLLKHEYCHLNTDSGNAEKARFWLDLDEFEFEVTFWKLRFKFYIILLKSYILVTYWPKHQESSYKEWRLRPAKRVAWKLGHLKHEYAYMLCVYVVISSVIVIWILIWALKVTCMKYWNRAWQMKSQVSWNHVNIE